MRNPASPSKPRFLSLAARIWYWRERHAMLDRFARPNFHLILTVLAICIFLVALFPGALFSQQSSSPRGAAPIWPMHDSSPAHGLPDAVGTTPPAVPLKHGSCLLWVVAETPANTVSAATLQIPGKAHAEYEKGCGDLRDRKFDGAETHLRKAVQLYPRYAEAMVLLGQLLAARNRAEDALGACTQASGVDPDFVPAYLCLADVSGQLRQWSHTLEFADHAVKLDPVQNLYGHFYLAIAQFHLSQFSGAEENALQTIDADHLHRLPQAHLLLAQIYGSRHDLKGAATQLRAYLFVAPKSPDAPAIRKSLEDLESQISR